MRKDGTQEQYRDFEHEADAQYLGNSWVAADGKRYGFISIETQGVLGESWTDQQIATLREDLHWLSSKYGFPLAMVRLPEPGSVAAGGIGYHSLFAAWNPNSHSCPGPERVAQIPRLLTSGDLSMADAQDILNAVNALDKKESDRYADYVARFGVVANLVRQDIAANLKVEDVVAGVVAALPKDTTVDEAAVAKAVVDQFVTRLSE